MLAPLIVDLKYIELVIIRIIEEYVCWITLHHIRNDLMCRERSFETSSKVCGQHSGLLAEPGEPVSRLGLGLAAAAAGPE